MSDYLDKIQTQKKDGTPLATVPFRDSAAREDITTIQNEITTDTTTVEGNPLNFTTLSAQTAKSTIISVEPIQDLHGYDKPWVGGAGKNKTDASDVTKDSSGYIIGANSSGKDWINENHDTFSAGAYTFSFYASDFTNNSATQLSLFNNDTAVITKAVNNRTGRNIITVFPENDFNKIALYTNSVAGGKFTKMQFESGEQASDYAPYTNLCPITGRTKIGILGCGKNLISGYQANRCINGSGQIASDGATCISNYIRLKDNVDYTLAYTKSASNVVAHCFDEYGNYLSYVALGTTNPVTFSTNNLKNGTKNIYIQWNEAGGGSILPTNGQLEISSSATDYSPYTKSNDLTISFGQTVYGGTLDVENGVLVVDRICETFDGSSDEGIALASEEQGLNKWRIIAKISDNSITFTEQKTITGKIWSDKFAEVPNADNSVTPIRGTFYGEIGIHYRVDGSHNVIIAPQVSSIVDEASARTWLSNNPTQICYTLATPITINLTPNTINLLKGINNISTDGDKITLTYRDGSVATLEDVKLASEDLEKQIADAQILTDTVTGDKYILVVTNGVLSVEQVSD